MPFALAHQAVEYLPSFAVGLRLGCPAIHSRTHQATKPPTRGQPSHSLRLAMPRLREMTNAAKAHVEVDSVNKRYSIDSGLRPKSKRLSVILLN